MTIFSYSLYLFNELKMKYFKKKEGVSYLDMSKILSDSKMLTTDSLLSLKKSIFFGYKFGFFNYNLSKLIRFIDKKAKSQFEFWLLSSLFNCMIQLYLWMRQCLIRTWPPLPLDLTKFQSFLTLNKQKIISKEHVTRNSYIIGSIRWAKRPIKVKLRQPDIFQPPPPEWDFVSFKR